VISGETLDSENKANIQNFGLNRIVSYLFNFIQNQSNYSKFLNTYLNTIYTRRGLSQ